MMTIEGKVSVTFSPFIKEDLHGVDYNTAKQIILQLTDDAMEGVLLAQAEPCLESSLCYETYYVRTVSKWGMLNKTVLFPIIFEYADNEYTILNILISPFDKWWLKSSAVYNQNTPSNPLNSDTYSRFPD